MYKEDTAPRIYVRSLAAYNSGRGSGAWIDANQDPEDIRADIAALLARDGGEEWAVHDFEGLPNLGEHPNVEGVAEAARLSELFGATAFKLWHGLQDGLDCTQWEDGFTAQYMGEWDDPKDYVYSHLEDTGALSDVPEWLRGHIDLASIWRDWDCGGMVAYPAGGVYHILDPSLDW